MSRFSGFNFKSLKLNFHILLNISKMEVCFKINKLMLKFINQLKKYIEPSRKESIFNDVARDTILRRLFIICRTIQISFLFQTQFLFE